MPIERSTIWIAILRQFDGVIGVDGVMTLQEAMLAANYLNLRMRYNPDIRLTTIRLPAGTQRQQVFDALEQLSDDELVKLYRLPTHKMMETQ